MKTQNLKSELTKNEKEVLVALVKNAKAVGDTGVEFLIDEVADSLGKSLTSVAATVGNLQKKGLVDCYGRDYYFSGAVTPMGMTLFSVYEPVKETQTKKEVLEGRLKTAKQFQDSIKDCKSEAAKEYQKQAETAIEELEKELAKENKADSKPEAPQAEKVPEAKKKAAKIAPKTLGVDWSYYDAPRFDKINKKYLPTSGEGTNMATQIVTAVNKLIYKWYNDGDVFDNQHGMEGWANDLSSYANWLAKFADGAKVILDQIFDCYHKHIYEHILKELADLTMRMSYLNKYEKIPAIGSVYDCDGDYEFREESGYDDEEEEW